MNQLPGMSGRRGECGEIKAAIISLAPKATGLTTVE